jgi:hypothetical protein
MTADTYRDLFAAVALAAQKPAPRRSWSAEAVANGGRFPRRERELSQPERDYHRAQGVKAARAEAAKRLARFSGPSRIADYLRESVDGDRALIESAAITLDGDGDEGAWLAGFAAGLSEFRADLRCYEDDDAARTRLVADGVAL